MKEKILVWIVLLGFLASCNLPVPLYCLCSCTRTDKDAYTICNISTDKDAKFPYKLYPASFHPVYCHLLVQHQYRQGRLNQLPLHSLVWHRATRMISTPAYLWTVAWQSYARGRFLN